MNIEISGIDALKSRLGNFSTLLPKALNIAINRTAQEVKDAEVGEMRRVFDRPTPFTLKSVYVQRSTRRDLTAEVGLKWPELSKTENPLTAQVRGGPRKYKRVETILRSDGILPQGMYVMPARDAWLDQYGNIRGPEIVQILSSVKAFGETGYLMNRTGKSRSKTKNRYFVKYREGRPIGIWERLGKNNARAVLMFMHAPTYTKRLDFYKVAEHTAYARLNKNIKEAIRQTIEWSKQK